MTPSSIYDPHWALYPKAYVATRSIGPVEINGDLEKPVWNSVPWSDLFEDIQGNDAPANAISPAKTAFKAIYDDEHLYVGALLHPSPVFRTEAHFTTRNSPIYQTDSDFEVFFDLNGSNHGYKEFEVNALNTVWNLMLDKPYDDGGHEHSGRIAHRGDSAFYDVNSQTTAVQVLEGRLNDASNQGALWSVEMAFAFEDLAAHLPSPVPRPSPGEFWRINFSRVELKGEVNWTWQPQKVWDPHWRKHHGKVAMHMPDSWGYLIFGDTVLELDNSSWRDPLWPTKLAAMNIYYAQHFYKSLNGFYTDCMEELAGYLDLEITSPFKVDLVADTDRFLATVSASDEDQAISILDDRLLQVIPSARMSSTAV
jgi:hypothetical protein